jgi:hypothetical protein
MGRFWRWESSLIERRHAGVDTHAKRFLLLP